MTFNESTSPRKEFPHQSLQEHLRFLIQTLHKLIQSMPDSHYDVEKIAQHLLQIGKEIEIAGVENGGNPREAIFHILNQPLFVTGSSRPISLLQAAKEFTKEDVYESDLFKILSTFHEFPGPTHTLITELEILGTEFTS